MTKRGILIGVGLWCLALQAAVALAGEQRGDGESGPAAGTVVRRPNIVLFIADDLSWHDVACFGGPTDAKTPHLDALAGEGMRLTGFFSSSSVCSPARQELLTGLYPVRSGAYPNHSKVRSGTKSLPHCLAALGYRTACVGKTHFGPAACYPFDVMIPMRNGAGSGEAGDAGDGELDMAAMERFITAGAEPFCVYVATHEPHSPWTKGDPQAYDSATVTLPPYLVDTPETRDSLARYYAEVTAMDAQMGAVLRMVAKTGHEQDTLVMFFSEHGNSMPQGKWTCYDAGIRVAAIARWPGRIQPGATSAALVQYVDVLPTLIEAAGGEPTKLDTGCPDADGGRGFDGRSFLDVLLGRTQRHRDFVCAQHTARGIINGPKAYGTRAIREARWKLIVNLHSEAEFCNAISDGEVLRSWRRKGEHGDPFAAAQAARYTKRPAVELYDLEADPWELTNMAAEPEHEATVARLRTQLDAWMRQQGDEGDATERRAHEQQGLR